MSSKVHIQQTPTFIDDLANALYTPENIERANAYVRTRGLDPSVFPFPWAASGDNPAYFEYFRNVLPPIIFTDCLYIPILEIDCTPEKPVLAGFDVRYMGERVGRLRWSKRKRHNDSALVYNVHAALKGDNLILTEGAMDAEAFRTVGFEAIGALTALYTPRFVYFMVALGKKIYLAYDNDEDGRKATDKILKHIQKYPNLAGFVQPLVYPTKDPSHALQTLGAESFRTKIQFQLT